MLVGIFILVMFISSCSEDTTGQSGPYNLSLVSNTSSIVGLAQKVNTELMFGYFGDMLVLTIGIIFFMHFIISTGDAKRALASSAYIVMTIAMLLNVLDMVSVRTVFITLFTAAVSTLFLYLGR
jgi:hypothetical protein